MKAALSWGVWNLPCELGAGVDELQVDLLQGPLLGVGQQRLPQGQSPLLGSDATSLNHDEVLLDLSPC